MTKIKSYKELRVFHAAMEVAMVIFQVSKTFPAEERFSMVDQIRRCSRSALRKPGRGMAKAALQGAFCEQAERC